MHRFGLHSFRVKGGGYHDAALKAGQFGPGAPIRLVREPDHPQDPNALAVNAQSAHNKPGYVPAAHAKRTAKLLDAGIEHVAVSTRGAGPGAEGTLPQILVCERTLFEHLTSSKSQ